jgi:small conductance mechanosensitive channel
MLALCGAADAVAAALPGLSHWRRHRTEARRAWARRSTRWRPTRAEQGLERPALWRTRWPPSVKGRGSRRVTGRARHVALCAEASLGLRQTTSFVVVLGAAGFAVGLALQGSLSNFAAGVLLLLFRPFKVGDYVKAGGTEGEVKDIHLFVTELATLDNVQVIVSNSAIMGGLISNLSGYDKRRVDLLLSVGHGVSLARVKVLAERILADDPRVLKDPSPQVVVRDLTPLSIDLYAWSWVHPKDYWGVYFDMYRRLEEAFGQAGITGTVPTHVVRVLKDEAP